ncbi:MAG: aspartyl/glutamyl-tRNA amidotransferase subunit C [Planctomycetota bacterium]
MDVDERLVRHVAGLARLDLTDAEVARLVPQMASILAYVERVAALPGAEEAAPSADLEAQAIDLEALRPDDPEPPLDLLALIRQAPAGDGAFYVVPRFLGEDETPDGGDPS